MLPEAKLNFPKLTALSYACITQRAVFDLRAIVMEPVPVGKPLRVKGTFSGRTGVSERKKFDA